MLFALNYKGKKSIKAFEHQYKYKRWSMFISIRLFLGPIIVIIMISIIIIISSSSVYKNTVYSMILYNLINLIQKIWFNTI